ncbi:hypothetical protein ACN28S_59710 [Cystobacter fuscus]
MPSPRVVLLSTLLLGLPLQGALAQPRPPAVVPVTATQERTIRVEGQGEVKVSPDEPSSIWRWRPGPPWPRPRPMRTRRRWTR